MPRAARAVGVLVAEALLVARRLDHAHPLPVGLELVGHDHRHAGPHALAHLGAVARDADDAVGRDGHEDQRVVHPAIGHAVGAVLRRIGGPRRFGENPAARTKPPAAVMPWRKPRRLRLTSTTGRSVTPSARRALIARSRLAGRRLLDRGPHPHIGPAAADIAAHGLVDLGVGRLRRALEQRGGRHDLPGLAVAALRHAHVHPGGLQRPADPVGADGLDGGDLAAAHRRDRRLAGAHRLPVHVHGTGAAQRHAAAVLGAGEAQLVAQGPQQRGVVGEVDVVPAAVDGD